MKCYRIEVVKDIGGNVVNMPVITTENLENAECSFEDIILDEFNELNHEMMRNVGGRSEIYLYKSDNILHDGDVIKHVTVKRPLHSPSASVFRLGEDGNE